MLDFYMKMKIGCNSLTYKMQEQFRVLKGGALHPMKQKTIENKPFYITENVKKRLSNKFIIQKVVK